MKRYAPVPVPGEVDSPLPFTGRADGPVGVARPQGQDLLPPSPQKVAQLRSQQTTVPETMAILERALSRLERLTGRHPAMEEVARNLGLELEEYLFVLEEVYPVPLLTSVGAPGGSADPQAGGFEMQGGENFDSFLLDTFLIETLAKAISDLPEKEGLVVTLRHYEKLTSHQISDALNLPESTVHQLHSQAMIRMRVQVAETPYQGRYVA
ncbi:hypothetical protein LPW11_13620 [Geomonas sp. RF6]|uniref:sigma-70 family RNA polymerase sigma factor n=1 Tax=Geomonas sp. RF6 TaxID=2897342 RepID=UPI001E434839|nr:sigma factor-like helix-turn-helix DNA-binding protein [Geomonas sp. RF6]UFS68933.1 hypothetical protein LPW11_13620 [Geomonas sp. RF6]